MWLALSIALGTAAVFAALGIHIFLGGAFEMRTVAAMSLRTTVWAIIFAFAARRTAARAWGERPPSSDQRGASKGEP